MPVGVLAERARHELLHGDLKKEAFVERDRKSGSGSRKSSSTFASTISERNFASEKSAAWDPLRSQLADFLDSDFTESVMTTVMVLNLIMAVLIVDTEAAGNEVPVWLRVSMQLLVIIYCVELSARIYVYRSEFFSKALNNFDVLIIVADITSTAAEVFADGVSVDIAPFRIIRALRMLRTAKIMIRFRSLYLLINGLAGAIRAIAWAFVMLSLALILCSIFAVAVIQPYVHELATNTDVFDGCTRCPVAYSTVWHSYITLFQQIVAGDSWGTVTIHVMDAQPWTAAFFIPTFLLIQLGLINMILAVIVDRAEDAREANCALRLEVKERELSNAQKSLRDMCASMDEDDSGELTLDEALDGYDNNKEFHEILRLMDIDKEDMKCVFTILDQDRSGSCSYQEFADALWKMRTQDSHTLLVFIKAYVTDMKHSIEESMGVLKDDIRIKMQELHKVHFEEEGSLSPRISIVKTISTGKDLRLSCNQTTEHGQMDVQRDTSSKSEIRSSDDVKKFLQNMSSTMEQKFDELSQLLLEQHGATHGGQATRTIGSERVSPPHTKQFVQLPLERANSTISQRLRTLGSAQLPQPQAKSQHAGWPAACCVVTESAAVSKAPCATPPADLPDPPFDGACP